MGSITFLNPALYEPVTVPVPERGQDTLLSLSEKYRLPLRCDCKSGVCGTCAVKVAPLHRDGPHAIRLSGMEKEVLHRLGKLSDQQYRSEQLPDMPPLWRLACQYVVEDEDIWVAL